MSAFSHRLIALRRGRGLSQLQLGARAGIDSAVISRLERGLAPSITHCIRRAEALDTSQSALLKLAAEQHIDRAVPR